MPATQATQAGPNFKVGDKAVYPGQGVGEVMGIEHKEVAGQRQSFYVLRILENGMKIMIPMNKVNSVGLREIIGEKDVRRVYTILREKEVSVDSTTWNRRYREYMDKIKTGSVFEIAEVLRDLYLLRSDKDLSFGERNGGALTAGLFLKEFAGSIPWVHVDLAGPATEHKEYGAWTKGGTGFGLATIVEYLTRQTAS